MGSTPELTTAQWRKSSYSGDDGGECVECAPLGGAAWRKSSYSGHDGADCVEVAEIATRQRVAVRDSKNPHGPTLLLSPAAFADFVTATATGAL
ncbi:DUF397 domain-containing protein [Streptomyces sp. NA02950]|uniref:DUF397 domain-containing protein n=1 Tax=Streptomyces sp. NA02950 TaxID=2742137 RepID=UPI0015916020|nr:DUF397 domain-containing protein [Streptomyces sp. NA02950]QKV95446.1 DUF397 domain-containing protein [Streptomyces sp. NA02950]